MLGPRYVLGSYQKKLYDMDYEKHMKRLNEIKKPLVKSQSEGKHILFRNTLSDLHAKRMDFQKSEMIFTIDKTNQVLLDKLVKISRNEKPPLFKPQAWSGHPGTLNTTYRKQNLERIALENEAFAKRLISQNGSLSHKRLKSEFSKHQDLLKQVQKVPSPTKKHGKLDSLQSPKSGEPKKFKLKKKKKLRKSALEQGTAVTEGAEYETQFTQEAQHTEGFQSPEKLYKTEQAHMTEEDPKKEDIHVQQETQRDEDDKTTQDNAQHDANSAFKEKANERLKVDTDGAHFNRKEEKAKTQMLSPQSERKEETPKSDNDPHRRVKRSGTIQHPSRSAVPGRKLSQYSNIRRTSQLKSEVQDSPGSNKEAVKDLEKDHNKEKLSEKEENKAASSGEHLSEQNEQKEEVVQGKSDRSKIAESDSKTNVVGEQTN